ncbi:MAG: hypothetical protein ACXVPD_12560, partial [Bacteroidia bacterium]
QTMHFIMKQLVLILAALLALPCVAQSVYKNLEIKKIYSVAMDVDSAGGKKVYKIDSKVVDKSVYDKYHDAWKDVQNCKPCMLETYDINNKLLFKAVKYTDCPVGEWTSYYPTGKIKEKGMYRENDTGVWEDLWNSGYCIKHGTWTYYDENGKMVRQEKYSFGNLQENK